MHARMPFYTRFRNNNHFRICSVKLIYKSAFKVYSIYYNIHNTKYNIHIGLSSFILCSSERKVDTLYLH